MDRASDSGSEGWGFESLPACQINKRDTRTGIPLIYLALRAEGLEPFNAARMSAARDGSTERHLNVTSPFRHAKEE